MDKFLIQGGYRYVVKSPCWEQKCCSPTVGSLYLNRKTNHTPQCPRYPRCPGYAVIVGEPGVKVDLVSNHTWRVQASQVRPLI
jgi:hypothetical protein